jgi:cation transport regulator
MPYQKNSDIPEDIRGKLPEHAQDIFREAFNSAYEQYVKGKGQDEGHAFAVAWNAVEQKYKKNEKTNKWEKKTNGE